MSKTLILFYSLEGSTRKIAQSLAKELNFPFEELKPMKEMKSKGFMKYVQGGGQAVAGIKPALQPLKSNLKNYDTIIIGSPVWAGRFTPAVKSLLEKGLLKKKKIAFFYCNEGGPGKIEKKIKSSVERYNTLISTCSIVTKGDELISQKAEALKWVRKVIK